MEGQQRKRYTSEEKVAILKEHLTGKKPVSEVCERYGVAVNMFYRWQEEFFAKASGVFDSPRPHQARDSKLEKRVADLESRRTRKHQVLSELMEEHVTLKKTWGDLKAEWVPHDTRDLVINFVNTWAKKTEIPVAGFIRMLGVCRSKFYDWRERYGKVNEHSSWIPRDRWLLPWERDAIIGFFCDHPLDGYRRLAFMMLDRDVVAASPSSVYRVLKRAGLLESRFVKPS